MQRMPSGLAQLLSLLSLSLLGRAGPVSATICHADTVPAATLLLPYFEVNLGDPNGLTTLFSVNNAAAPAVLAHVAIWSDLAVPILNFNVYLTGYDVQTINLRDVILNGRLPQTASTGQDPGDTISPRGPLSQDTNFVNCQGLLPPPPLTAAYLSHLQRALTGLSSPITDGLCAGQALGDNIARGYVTVDTVNNCTLRFPGDAGYFPGNGPADVTDQNVLWGSWYIVNGREGFAQGSDLVAIEADGTNPATSTPGRYTFYGRYVGWTAVDHREPLATTFAVHDSVGGTFSAGTSLLAWRDTKVAQAPVPCPATPGAPVWYPLGEEGLVIFDEQEHPFELQCNPVIGGCPNPFIPFVAATQRTLVNGAALPVPFPFGWLYLDLNLGVAGTNPPADPNAAQAWVVSTESSGAHFAVAFDAFRLDSACTANHFVP